MYRPFPTGGFDIARRLQDMDATGVDVHVLSATPQTYLYNQEAALGATLSAIQNDQIAKHIAAHPTRFMGIATLPMQDPKRAADELTRAMTKLGLQAARCSPPTLWARISTIRASSRCGRRREELGAFMFIHPNNVAGADRLKSYYLHNLIGNPLDTTIAAACLVFGGVIDRYPKLKFCLAHGGGFMPYQAARWSMAGSVRPEPKKNIPQAAGRPSPAASSTTPSCIPTNRSTSMIERVGADRVMLGSDYPYDMAMMDCVAHVRGAQDFRRRQGRDPRQPRGSSSFGKGLTWTRRRRSARRSPPSPG